MLGDLTGMPGPRAGRIDLHWTWSADTGATRPGHRLLRCDAGYPDERPGQAMELATVAGRLPDDPPGGATVQLRYHAPTGDGGDPATASFASVTFRSAGVGPPWQVLVEYRDRPGGPRMVVEIADVTSIEHEDRPGAGWAHRETLRLRDAADAVCGTVEVHTAATDPGVPNEWYWVQKPDDPVRVCFDSDHTRRAARLGNRYARWPARRPDGAPVPPPPASAYLETVEVCDLDTGDWHGEADLADLSAPTGVVSYYALVPLSAAGPDRNSPRCWAVATRGHGWAGRLYRQLPAIHRHLDEPAPDQHGAGQLRAFLAVFETMLDHLHGRAEALRLHHDVSAGQPDTLPLLADWIGWTPDRSAPTLTQRHDIEAAPTLFTEVGTGPALQALVRRFTGVDCRLREFGRNVFYTNAPEPVELWELWERTVPASGDHGGTIPPAAWGPPHALTRTEEMDASPTVALWRAPTGTLELRYFWQSDRDGTWGIWSRGDRRSEPERVHGGLSGQHPVATASGTELWLVWSDAGDVWARRLEAPDAGPTRITYSARASHPAAAVDGTGRFWIFWESDRSGYSDIWVRVRERAGWLAPHRVTSGQAHDHAPAACVDDRGRVWLVWSRDTDGGSALWAQVHEAGYWSQPQCLGESDGPQRDQAPTIIWWQRRLWVFWHSDRGTTWPAPAKQAQDRWRLWGRCRLPPGASRPWGPAFAVTGLDAGDPAPPVSDKEPAAVVDDAGALRVCWRSRRRGVAYRSCTVDTTDRVALGRLGRFDDRTHVTPGVGTGPAGRYQPGSVGIFLDPGATPPNPAVVAALLEPFRPVQTRYHCLTEPDAVEMVPTGDVVTESTDAERTTDG